MAVEARMEERKHTLSLSLRSFSTSALPILQSKSEVYLCQTWT